MCTQVLKTASLATGTDPATESFSTTEKNKQ